MCRTWRRCCASLTRAAPGGRVALVDLYQEDGSFHGDNAAKGVHHSGFRSMWLQTLAEQAGLHRCGVARSAAKCKRSNGRYPLRLCSPAARWRAARAGISICPARANKWFRIGPFCIRFSGDAMKADNILQPSAIRPISASTACLGRCQRVGEVRAQQPWWLGERPHRRWRWWRTRKSPAR